MACWNVLRLGQIRRDGSTLRSLLDHRQLRLNLFVCNRFINTYQLGNQLDDRGSDRYRLLQRSHITTRGLLPSVTASAIPSTPIIAFMSISATTFPLTRSCRRVIAQVRCICSRTQRLTRQHKTAIPSLSHKCVNRGGCRRDFDLLHHLAILAPAILRKRLTRKNNGLERSSLFRLNPVFRLTLIKVVQVRQRCKPKRRT